MMWTGDCFTTDTESMSDSAFVSGKHHVIKARGGSKSRQNLIVPAESGDGDSLPRLPRCE